MTPPRTSAIAPLARDVRAARMRLHMTTAIMASQIGISESALRRIENGTSHATRAETAAAILVWAMNRGYREFAGFPTARWAAEAVAAWGERFEALGRAE